MAIFSTFLRPLGLSLLGGLTLAMGTAAALQLWAPVEFISDTFVVSAPELGAGSYRLQPDLDGANVVIPDRPHDPIEVHGEESGGIDRRRSFKIWSNSWGLRGPSKGLPRVTVPAPGFRILVVGDSVPFGWGITYEESYPTRLAGLLGVEVLNAAVPAMKPDTVSAWTQQNARGLDPDLVIFSRRVDHGSHNSWHLYQNSVRTAAQSVAPARLVVVLQPISTFDVKGSMNWEAEAAETVRRLAPVPVLDLTPVFRAQKHNDGVLLELTPGHQRVVQASDGKVLLDVQTSEHRLSPRIAEMFEDDESLREPLFFDGGHPDSEGAALFASTLADWLRGRRLVR